MHSFLDFATYRSVATLQKVIKELSLSTTFRSVPSEVQPEKAGKGRETRRAGPPSTFARSTLPRQVKHLASLFHRSRPLRQLQYSRELMLCSSRPRKLPQRTLRRRRVLPPTRRAHLILISAPSRRRRSR